MVPLSAGVMLVANPELPDGDFDRTVVLILAHGLDGSIGVILNRRGTHPVVTRFAGWGGLVGDGEVIFQGGPVNPDALIGLAVGGPDVAGPLPDGVMSEVFAGVGIVDLDRPHDRAEELLCALRVFAGYAGWSPGQLAGEIEVGAWWVVRPRSHDVRTGQPESLWRAVLRRQRGPLALVSSYSESPELN